MPRDPLIPLTLPPGFASDGTSYQHKNRWIGGDLVRFFQGKVQPIGGWSARTPTGVTITGIPRAAVAMPRPAGADHGGSPAFVVATTTGVFAIIDDEVFDVSPAGLATDSTRTWELEVFGHYLIALDCRYSSTDPSLAGGVMYAWDGITTGALTEVQNGPLYDTGGGPAYISATGLSLVATEDRFLVMLGGYEPGVEITLATARTTPINQMVNWATQEGGLSAADWVASDVNSAGSFPLATTGILRGARRVRGGTLILTSLDAWLMRYIGSTLVHSFEQQGTNCGAISKKALVGAGGGAFWMGHDGFFEYDGYAREVPCEIRDEIFNDLERDLQHLIWGFENPAFNEVTWFYPSSGATEIDSYVTFNYESRCFYRGALARTAGVSAEIFGNTPVLCGATGTVYDHETGTTMSGAGTPYIETGPLELGEGDAVATMNGLYADASDETHLQVTAYSAFSPLGAETTVGPTALSAGFTGMRVKGRQIRLKFTQAVAAAWRLGTMRISARPGSPR